MHKQSSRVLIPYLRDCYYAWQFICLIDMSGLCLKPLLRDQWDPLELRGDGGWFELCKMKIGSLLS